MVDNFDSNFLAMSCRPEFMNMLVSQTLGNHRSTPKKASFRNREICKKTEKNLVNLSQSKQKFRISPATGFAGWTRWWGEGKFVEAK